MTETRCTKIHFKIYLKLFQKKLVPTDLNKIAKEIPKNDIKIKKKNSNLPKQKEKNKWKVVEIL